MENNLFTKVHTFRLKPKAVPWGPPRMLFIPFLIGLALGSTSKAALFWSDNFENGWGDWTVEGSVWQIGKPTTGLGALSGTNCAGTILTGDYPSSVDARLISPPFSVPSAAQHPRLRFWSWHRTNGTGDYGQVQIRTNGGPWISLTEQLCCHTGGAWMQRMVDLSAYGGQTVQLGLHFVSDSINVDLGWYVDDISVETAPLEFYNPEGFEKGWRDWTVEGSVWQIGNPSTSVGTHSGTNCAGTILTGNYPSSVDARLISPPFSVPSAAQHPSLRFWSWHDTNGTGDYGQVQIRTNGGPWISLTEQLCCHTGGAWMQRAVDLSTYGGQTVQLAFHFVSDSFNTDLGWYVDDVEILPFVQPRLEINRLAGSNVVLSWTTNTVEFQLESTASLTSAAWTPVIPAPVNYGGKYFVTNAISAQIRLYRLRYP